MPKLSREQLDERRQHILRAAAVCFARDGFHRTTIADVRRQAGVSTGAIYTYFPNKEAIVRAMLEQARQERSAQLGAAQVASDGLSQARVLLHWVHAIFAKGGPEVARVDVNLWAEAVRSPRVAKIARAALDEAARTVGAVVAQRLPATRKRKRNRRELDAISTVLVAIFLGLEVQTAVGVPVDGDGVVRMLGLLFGTQLEPEATKRKTRAKKARRKREER